MKYREQYLFYIILNNTNNFTFTWHLIAAVLKSFTLMASRASLRATFKSADILVANNVSFRFVYGLFSSYSSLFG